MGLVSAQLLFASIENDSFIPRRSRIAGRGDQASGLDATVVSEDGKRSHPFGMTGSQFSNGHVPVHEHPC